ncbi:MAG: triphosphoribosyl-dephospho-CoA synthase [Vulcanimicrobiaceae bacterium]
MSSVAALAGAATAALVDELATTPKPGLVDLEHSGAHRDLCFARLHDSAHALEATFRAIGSTAEGQQPSRALREEIGALARHGERAMLAASGGSNTHRGALWALGLLVAGAAAAPARSAASAVAARAGAFARLADRFAPPGASHGASVARRYGASGARGEAAADFPHVVELALPLVRRGRARADVLLALLARVDDTCVLHRGGPDALAYARTGAIAALRAGGTSTRRGLARTRALDAALVARNVSPGGCADLLAAALFLDAIAG